MSALHLTQLSEDERIVFGLTRSTKDSKISVKKENDPINDSHASFRTVCITNFRVIIEMGDSIIQFPNKDITRVQINKTKVKGSPALINILKINTISRNTIKVGLFGIELEKAKQLGNIFPNAIIKESHGFAQFIDKILGT